MAEEDFDPLRPPAFADGQIQGVSAIANPDKLQHLGPVADLGALLRGR
jgi:hypothetical protein